jgi:hypothetical protein
MIRLVVAGLTIHAEGEVNQCNDLGAVRALRGPSSSPPRTSVTG